MKSNTQLVAFQTIVNKEIVRFMRIWSQTLLPSAVTQTLYFLIFGGIIGSKIGGIEILDPSTLQKIIVPYMQFVVPGLVMMAVITNSFANTVSSFFGAKFQRSIEELLVAPVPNWIIVAGYTIGGALRGILVGVIVFVVAGLFGAIPRHVVDQPVISIFLILSFICLTSIVFSLAGLINGIYAKKFDDISVFPTFVLTPLTYLGGVFYSLNSIPEFWRNISKLNPIVYMVDGFRWGFFGFGEVNIWIDFGILAIFMIILIGATNYLLNKGIGMRS